MANFKHKLHHPLSETEFVELDRFLASPATGDTAMMVDTLDGYLTAIALGPVDIPLAQWLPRIWGVDEKPNFRNEAQADRILSLIVRQLNGIVRSLDLELDSYRPILDVVEEGEGAAATEYEDGEMWAFGFMAGINLARGAWQPVFENPEALAALKPIYLLGEKNLPPEQQAEAATVAQRAALAAQIPATVATLYRFWLPSREADAEKSSTVQYDAPRTGRNDACPCGSGKKFKKCCGAN